MSGWLVKMETSAKNQTTLKATEPIEREREKDFDIGVNHT